MVSLVLAALVLLVIVFLSELASLATRETSNEFQQLRSELQARLALSVALGTLQSELGSDQRVTASADLVFPATEHHELVGVWEAAANPWVADPDRPAPDYRAQKETSFRRWLTSDPQAEDPTLPDRGVSTDGVLLFDHPLDPKLQIRAQPIDVPGGKIAWAVVDEGMKARVNLGEDVDARLSWETAAVPAGPGLEISQFLSQPVDGWAERLNRLKYVSQVPLDGEFGYVGDPDLLSPHFTTLSRGVLSDVAQGGLKRDLSLAFEMSDASFDASRWGERLNPFRNGPAPAGEVPIYRPVNEARPPIITVDYDGRANETREFPTGGVPTFDHLRSHYRLYRETGPERAPVGARIMSSCWWDSSQPSRGGVTPVLNRVLLFFSPWVDPNDPSVLRIVLTPLVVLWNPYDVPLRAPAFFAHPRLDFPVGFTIDLYRNGSLAYRFGRSYMGGHLGRGLPTSPGSGRSLEPYFLMQMTRSGTNSFRDPIVIGPGEVRLFGPAAATPVSYFRTASQRARTLRMKPVDDPTELHFEGGFAVRLNQGVSARAADNWTFPIQAEDELRISANFAKDRFHYMMTLENEGRLVASADVEILSEVMVYRAVGLDSNEQFVNAPPFLASELDRPRPVAVLETFNRTANEPGSLSNILFTVNPRQRYINAMLSGAQFTSGPHYQTDFREVSDFLGSGLQITPDGQRTFYGPTNESLQGRDRLAVFAVPNGPILSLGQFQHADLADTAFAPANPFGNSWASPYVDSRETARIMNQTTTSSGESIVNGLALYDHAFLLNHGLWDGYFFSSFGDGTDVPPVVQIRSWLQDPTGSPLPNPRIRPYPGSRSDEAVVTLLTGPDRPLWVAAHAMVEGAFNINSTDVESWLAVLTGLRGRGFDAREVDGRPYRFEASGTPFFRKVDPVGVANDAWTGFRELDDEQMRELASAIVREIRERGPFLSLGEFVNRRLGRDDLSRKGALQDAIDTAGVNDGTRIERFETTAYPEPANLPEPFTGVGIPGWLTQADLLTALGSFVSARSDTFIVRAGGEVVTAGGDAEIIVYEATVQRVPGFVDPTEDELTPASSLGPINRALGRRLVVTNLRRVDP